VPSDIITIEIVKTWIQDCDNNHVERLRAMEKKTTGHRIQGPSRVFDIGSTENQYVKIITANPVEKYVTLSYCWGGDDSMKLLKDTLTDWKREISFYELPRTIKNAIFTTRRMGH
jgi:hypothetical protein